MQTIQSNGKQIYAWVDGVPVEQSAIQQLKDVAELPFIFKHIAVMPDVHTGIGCCIGSVIPTVNAIVPSSVGVDIGCFEGSTRIPLLNGSFRTLKQLSKEKEAFYVYSVDKEGDLVPGRAIAKKTRRDASVMEVCVSGGEVIVCTPDHKFMLLDGTYKEAKDLQPWESLMPLYRSYDSRDGYEKIKTKKGTSIATHKMVAEYFLGKRKTNEVIHHKDGTWYNNSPENIEYKDKNQHSKDHRSLRCPFGTKEFKKRRLKTLQQNGFYGEQFSEKKKEIAVQNIQKYNRSSKKKTEDKKAGKRGRRYLLEENSKTFVCDECGKECKGSGAFGRHKKTHEKNHKVLWTKKTNRKIDVYCLQVEKYHNFALAAGVIVHNCGMIAAKTNLTVYDIPQNVRSILRGEIEKRIPNGRSDNGGKNDRGAWGNIPPHIKKIWNEEFEKELKEIFKKNPKIKGRHGSNDLRHLGTLGGGNHFIEICVDTENCIWYMIHSGSRGIGNRIGQYFIKAAKESCENGTQEAIDRLNQEKQEYFNSSEFQSLSSEDKKKAVKEISQKIESKKSSLGVSVHPDLAYFTSDSEMFHDYLQAMTWAQKYAYINRQIMAEAVCKALVQITGIPVDKELEVNCHHNYCSKETHFGQEVLVTRKGAISAQKGQWGIIPGSMGAKSYIVRGKGNVNSFCSASHGAGRKMSRSAAKKSFTVEDHEKATAGVECCKDASVLDETPMAYKDIDTVMEAEKDLVEPVYQLKQIICIKGTDK